MVCLGLEPGAAMMKAQRNPLSYDCIPFLLYFCLFKTVEEIKNCLWLYLNRGSLNSKATALPTVPHSIQRNFLLTGSVTRFGEFSPLWVTIIVLWPFRKCTFSIWQSGITACHQILMSALLVGHCCHLLTCKTLPIVTITINFCACKWRIFTTKLHFCSVNTSFNESRGRPVLVDLSGRSQGRFPCVSNVYQKIILLRTRQRLA